MSLLNRAALSAVAMVGLAVNAQAVDVTVNLNPGLNATGVVTAIGGAWNQGDFTCATNSNVLTITAVAGPCAGQTATLTVDVNNGGQLQQAHQLVLRVECNSLMSCEVELDGGGFQDVSNDTVSLVSGPDTITLIGSHPIPTLTEWGLLLSALLVVGGGAYMIRRSQSQPATLRA